MPTSTLNRLLPYTASQMFDLVIDVERYEEFMPFVFEAKIVGRDADELLATQTLHIGPVALHFESQAFFHRPDWIEIRSTSTQFQDFVIAWTFKDTREGCDIHVRVDCTPRSMLLSTLIAPWFDAFAGSLVNAFEKRAAAVYGTAP